MLTGSKFKSYETVRFIQGSTEFRAPLKRALCLNVFAANFFNKDIVIHQEDQDTIGFGQFMDFLLKGDIPSDFESQKNVIELLKLWDCDDELINEFNDKVNRDILDTILNHSGKEYRVRSSKIIDHSSVFKDLLFINSMEQIVVTDDFSQEAFGEFIDIINGKLKKPSEEHLNEVITISETYRCSYLGCILSPVQVEKDLSMLNQCIENGFDTSDLEKKIAKQLQHICNSITFHSLPLYSLIRILQKSTYEFKEDEAKCFFKNIIEIHGSSGSIIIPHLRIDKSLKTEDLLRIGISLPFEKYNIFSMLIQSMISMNTELDEYKKQIIELEKFKKELEECKKMIIETENKNKKGIKEILFTGDPFLGVFSHLTSKFGGNPIDNGHVSINASELHSASKPASELISGKGDYYLSEYKDNSYFVIVLNRSSLKITGYSIKTFNGGQNFRSWTVYGSQNNQNWVAVDKKIDCPDLKNSNTSVYFPCSLPSDTFFKYFKVQMDSKCWANHNAVVLNRFELFGSFQE